MRAALVVVLLAGVPLSLAAGPAASRAAPFPPGEVKPISVVILVDESGSLKAEDVRQEQEAAALLAVGEFSSRSQVEVVGFGSKNNASQQALDLVCPLTSLESRENRQSLQDCITKLHRRTEQEGYDTDHGAALAQAISSLGRDTNVNQAKIIFLLTDGVLDVRKSQHLGTTPEKRQAAAAEYIKSRLIEAGKQGIQIWPLGFGKADLNELKGFEAGGPCNLLSVSKPRAQVIQDSTQLFRAMVEAYSAARCASHQVTEPQIVSGGGTATYKLDISPIATDGAITVVKRNPRFQVTYIDPSGHEVPKSGTFDGSTFEASGQDTGVEGLRIGNPRSGTWQIRVTAPEGASRQEVLAAVVWQAAVHASVAIDSVPVPGDPVTVRSRLEIRQGNRVKPGDLHDLRFGLRLEGDGLSSTTTGMRDDGVAPDRASGDGEYAATVPIPSDAPGELTLTGVVTGEGVQGDEIPFTVRTASAGQSLRAVVDIPQQTIAPGEKARGGVEVTNATGQTVRAVLGLDGTRDGDHITLANASLDLPPGTSKPQLELVFAPDTALGSVPATITLRDRDDPKRLYGTGFVKVTVEYPPPWWQRYLWVLAALAVLAALLLSYLVARARTGRARRDVQDLTLVLYRGDQEAHPWRAPAGRAARVEFTVRNPDGDHPYLDRPGPGDPVYEVSRSRQGVVVRTPDLGPVHLRPGRPEPIGHGLGLAVRDGRLAPDVSYPPPEYHYDDRQSDRTIDDLL